LKISKNARVKYAKEARWSAPRFEMFSLCSAAPCRRLAVFAPCLRAYASKGFLGFKSPGDLVDCAHEAVLASERLQPLLLGSSDASASLRYADDISNVLCMAADAASGIQNANVSAEWESACSAAVLLVTQHMRCLNVNERIYEKLLSFSGRGVLSPSEESVLCSFIKDYEDSLVHLPLQQRLSMQRLLQRESEASESYLAADRQANSGHISVSSATACDSNFKLFPRAPSRRISANFADIVQLLQQTQSAATRAEVRSSVHSLHRPPILPLSDMEEQPRCVCICSFSTTAGSRALPHPCCPISEPQRSS
jgi:hypothetical protein